jgi:hypothetical protein
MSGALVASFAVELSRAAWAAAVNGPLLALGDAGPRERVRRSRPMRNARSRGARFPLAAVPRPASAVLLLILRNDLDRELLNMFTQHLAISN